MISLSSSSYNVHMLNIVIPMAGRGNRFKENGYCTPKPLIPIHGKEMIRIVIDNLKPQRKHRFIFLCLKEHMEKDMIDKKLKAWEPDCIVICVNRVTEGAACTVLLAEEHIRNADPLMIANCDQWIDADIDEYLDKMDYDQADGSIMTMFSDDPNCSYLRKNSKNEVTLVAEKQVISNEATVGIYNFKRGHEFVEYAENMIKKNIRTNNEFYVAPVYNEMLLDNKIIKTFDVGRKDCGMYGFGTPEDLDRFLSMEISRKAAQK